MYADDTHITYADVDVNSIQLNLNHDLGNLNKWLFSNKLTLNTAKTEFMLIGSRQKLSTLSSQPAELSIDNAPIEKVTCVKSLRIFIDENLRWQTHIDKLSKKIASGIGAIKLKELEILFQGLLSIVHTTLSFNLNSIIVILCGVIVENLCLTGYSSFRTVLLVF